MITIMDEHVDDENLPTVETEFSVGDRLAGRDGREYSVEDITVSIHNGNIFYELSPYGRGRQKTLVKSLVERDYQKA